MSTGAERIALVNGRLLGEDGAVRPGAVLIDGQAIAAVGATVDTTGAQEIDCTDQTIVPGLIDAHTHVGLAGLEPVPEGGAERALRAVRNLATLIDAGVTTIRDVGAFPGLAGALRSGLDRGWVRGPAFEPAGLMLAATGGHGTELGIACEADGPDGFRRAVRTQIAEGATLIKVAINGPSDRLELTPAELHAVVDEAHRHGLRVACHASCREAVASVLEATVDTVEHGTGLDAEMARRMAAEGVVLVPTAHAFLTLRAVADAGGAFPEHHRTRMLEALDRRIEDLRSSFAHALEAGVTLAAGTDALAGWEPVGVVDEMQAMVELGASVTDALAAAGPGGAAALGVVDRGWIGQGLRADLVAVPGRPDLDLLRQPPLVIAQGRLHPVAGM